MRTMKTIFLLFLFAGFLAAGSAALAEHAAHEHGVARLHVAVEKIPDQGQAPSAAPSSSASAGGAQVEIALETPLANVLSFERAPATAAERDEVRAMAALLHQADALFQFPEAARCRNTKISLESEAIDETFFLPPETANPTPATDGEKKSDAGEEAEHADLDAEFTFRCDNPAALDGLDVRLFAKFPNFREIEAELVTEKGQKAAELTPTSSRLGW
jgi:hypothetical protein